MNHRGSWRLALLAGLLLFATYLFTAYPTVGPRDSGELTTQAVVLGISHAPGYPLFALSAKAWDILIPWANHAYRINIASAFWTALAMAVFAVTLMKISPTPFLAFVYTMLLGWNNVLWDQAVVAEVFALHTASVSFLLFGMVALKTSSHALGILLAFCAGLGMGNHLCLAALLPGLLILWPGGFRRLRWFVLYFLLGTTVYLVLWIRSERDPLLDIGNISSLADLARHAIRHHYGVFSLHKGTGEFSWPTLVKGLSQFAHSAFPIGAVLLPLGLYHSWHWHARKTLAFLLCFILSGPAFIALARNGATGEEGQVMARFYGAPLLFLGLLTFPALQMVRTKALKQTIAGVLVLLALASLWQNGKSNRRQQYLCWDWGKDLLKSTEAPSLLFAWGDSTLSCLAYLQDVEGRHRGVITLFPGTSQWYERHVRNRWPHLTFSDSSGTLAERSVPMVDSGYSIYTTDQRILPRATPHSLLLQYRREPLSSQEQKPLIFWRSFYTGWRSWTGPPDAFLQEIRDQYRVFWEKTRYIP